MPILKFLKDAINVLSNEKIELATRIETAKSKIQTIKSEIKNRCFDTNGTFDQNRVKSLNRFEQEKLNILVELVSDIYQLLSDKHLNLETLIPIISVIIDFKTRLELVFEERPSLQIFLTKPISSTCVKAVMFPLEKAPTEDTIATRINEIPREAVNDTTEPASNDEPRHKHPCCSIM